MMRLYKNEKLLWSITLFVSAMLLVTAVNVVRGQVAGNLSSAPAAQVWIKIGTPVEGKRVPIDQDLLIAGQSSDDASMNCPVSVIVNNVKPYQSTFPTGSGGPTDYSQWNFTLSSNYTHLVVGSNRITAKLSCSPETTRWYSVSVMGFQTSQGNGNISLPALSPSVLNPANESTGLNATVESQQNLQSQSQSLPVQTNSGNTSESSHPETKAMSVAIDVAKNPVSRGSDQNITITVSDAATNERIAGAELVGKLLYPGGNYVKDFSGTTDSHGQIAHSWNIGKKGDIGQLRINVNVTAPGYESKSTLGEFQISAG